MSSAAIGSNVLQADFRAGFGRSQQSVCKMLVKDTNFLSCNCRPLEIPLAVRHWLGTLTLHDDYVSAEREGILVRLFDCPNYHFGENYYITKTQENCYNNRNVKCPQISFCLS